jgi:hypothetical protein
VLKNCDHVVTWRFGPRHGSLATEALRHTGVPVHLIPPFHFRGFHPDTIRVALAKGNLGGPTGAYHSRIAVAGFLGGLPPEDTARLYNRLVFSRLDYAGEFPRQVALLSAHLEDAGMDGAGVLARLRQGGCFMHSFEHPKPAPLLEMARAACIKMAVAPQADVELADIQDHLVSAPIHPFFADLAHMLGMAPDGEFRGPISADGVKIPIAPEEFVRLCYKVFAQAPRAALAEAEGVSDAMQRLGLYPA